jgi:hypothetical protein
MLGNVMLRVVAPDTQHNDCQHNNKKAQKLDNNNQHAVSSTILNAVYAKCRLYTVTCFGRDMNP